MIEDLISDIASGHRVEQTVFVECASGYRKTGPEALRPVGETDFVVKADPDGLVCGIVGFADLRITEIEDVLAAHMDAGAGRFRGVRQSSTWDPSPDISEVRPNPPGLLGDTAFRLGFAALGRAGLSFDAWLYHPQIAELTDLARAHPDVQIILDHLGGPVGIGPYSDRRDEVLTVWRRMMKDLATCPNVAVKLGGVGMPKFGLKWNEGSGGASAEEIASTWGGAIRWCIEQFGVDRCMFESNFPADRVSCSYATLWNAFKLITKDASSSEKEALYSDTATKVYRL